MRKTLISLFLLAITGWIPSPASAAITWSMSDGVTTKTSAFPPSGFAESLLSAAGTNHTLNLLVCTTPPCTRGFPSGSSATPLPSTDTFKIQDISSTNRARIEKIDVPAGGTATTGADSVVLRGIRVFALANGAGKTFTLTYATAAGDLSTITSSSGNYAGTAKLKGQFRLDTTAPIDGLSGAIAATCNNGVSSSCGQLSLKINLLTLNGTGSNLSTLVTASIPCSTDSSSASPCGSGGFWSPGLLAGDQFLATDTGSVGCGTTCAPFWESTLTVKFSALNQVFTLTNSAGAGFAPDDPEGLVDLAVALGEPGIDVWVGSCGGVQTGAQPYRVTGQPPFGNKGRNQHDFATFPMKFSLEKGQLQPATGGFPKFVSIDDPSEVVLPPGDRERNDSCSMSWVPSPFSRPKFSAITQLTLDYTAFVILPADSGDPRLGTLNFSDCTACFRVEIDLVDASGVSQGSLIVYTGSGDPFHQTNHADSVPPLVLVSDPGLRVDASDPTLSKPQPCCISFADAQSNGLYGKLFVRSITVVIDPGLGTGLNHLVTNLEAIVNGSSSNASMLTVGNFQPSCEWPPLDGLKIYVYKVLADGTREFVLNVLNPTIDFSLTTCPLTAQVKVTDLAGSGTYEATVIAFSAATDPVQQFIGGIAVPFSGIMILK